MQPGHKFWSASVLIVLVKTDETADFDSATLTHKPGAACILSQHGVGAG
jgi:hypothetical protein